jgi:hypothetical protein
MVCLSTYQLLALAVALPPGLWAVIKISGWVRSKTGTHINETTIEEVSWQDYVDDVESLDRATDVNSHQNDYTISLEYNHPIEQFHSHTEYDYKILDFKKPLLMVQPIDPADE